MPRAKANTVFTVLYFLQSPFPLRARHAKGVNEIFYLLMKPLSQPRSKTGFYEMAFAPSRFLARLA